MPYASEELKTYLKKELQRQKWFQIIAQIIKEGGNALSERDCFSDAVTICNFFSYFPKFAEYSYIKDTMIIFDSESESIAISCYHEFIQCNITYKDQQALNNQEISHTGTVSQQFSISIPKQTIVDFLNSIQILTPAK